MSVSAFFLISYGALRTISELFRAPDTHIGFLFVGTTMGQLLSDSNDSVRTTSHVDQL